MEKSQEYNVSKYITNTRPITSKNSPLNHLKTLVRTTSICRSRDISMILTEPIEKRSKNKNIRNNNIINLSDYLTKEQNELIKKKNIFTIKTPQKINSPDLKIRVDESNSKDKKQAYLQPICISEKKHRFDAQSRGNGKSDNKKDKEKTWDKRQFVTRHKKPAINSGVETQINSIQAFIKTHTNRPNNKSKANSSKSELKTRISSMFNNAESSMAFNNNNVLKLLDELQTRLESVIEKQKAKINSIKTIE